MTPGPCQRCAQADLALDTPRQYVEDLVADLVDGDGGHGCFSSGASRERSSDADVGEQGGHRSAGSD